MIFKIAVTGSTNKNHVSWAQLSIVYINNTACTLCFFSSQEKLGSHGFRQLSCVSRTAATWASGSADHYQHQHLALLSFFQAELIFFCFQKQEMPCALQWNLGLNISETNCCFYKMSWSDGLFYGFCLWEFFRVNFCEISKVYCCIGLRACAFFHPSKNTIGFH